MILFSDTKDITLEIIDDEINHVDKLLTVVNKLRKELLTYMEKITTAVNEITNPTDIKSIHNCLGDLRSNLDELNKNITSLKALIDSLKTFKETLQTIDKEKIENYNSSYKSAFSEYLDINISVCNFIESIIQYFIITFPEEKTSSEPEETADKEKTHTETTDTENTNKEKTLPVEEKNIDSNSTKTSTTLKENTLVISEKEQKIFLPYKLDILEKELKFNSKKYESIEEIIEKHYTVPLNNYKSPSLSRFREAFNLIKHKEKGSLTTAFDLGLELFFNFNLNPAIITACRNLDELDIYLSCLEDNELDKFDCFNIVYDYAPTVINKK